MFTLLLNENNVVLALTHLLLFFKLQNINFYENIMDTLFFNRLIIVEKMAIAANIDEGVVSFTHQWIA